MCEGCTSSCHGDDGGGLVTQLCLTLATPWTVACQAPLSVGFSRQESWSGLLFPSLVVMVILVISVGMSCVGISLSFVTLKYHCMAVNEQLIHELELFYFANYLGEYKTLCCSRNLPVSRTNENGTLLVYRRNTKAGRGSFFPLD